MNGLNWKYVTPLKDGTAINTLEEKYNFMLPDDLKACIFENNGGVPTLTAFDLGDCAEMVFGGLLSFNKGDADSIFDYIALFEDKEGKELKMFPFALDPAGNFFCIENNKVVLYKHEEDKTTVITDTFSDFLSMLY